MHFLRQASYGEILSMTGNTIKAQAIPGGRSVWYIVWNDMMWHVLTISAVLMNTMQFHTGMRRRRTENGKRGRGWSCSGY